MNREDYLKDYHKSLEEASLEVLEEHEGNTIAALEDYNAIGDKIQVKELENELKWVRDLIKKKGGN
jgi:hypothetical protein